MYIDEGLESRGWEGEGVVYSLQTKEKSFLFLFFTSCLTSIYNLSVMTDFSQPLYQTCTVVLLRLLYLFLAFDPLCPCLLYLADPAI